MPLLEKIQNWIRGDEIITTDIAVVGVCLGSLVAAYRLQQLEIDFVILPIHEDAHSKFLTNSGKHRYYLRNDFEELHTLITELDIPGYTDLSNHDMTVIAKLPDGDIQHIHVLENGTVELNDAPQSLRTDLELTDSVFVALAALDIHENLSHHSDEMNELDQLSFHDFACQVLGDNMNDNVNSLLNIYTLILFHKSTDQLSAFWVGWNFLWACHTDANTSAISLQAIKNHRFLDNGLSSLYHALFTKTEEAIVTNKQCVNVDYTDAGVVVRSHDTSISAQRAMLGCSNATLKELWLEPKLPAEVEVWMEKVTAEESATVHIRFDQPFWQPMASCLGLFQAQGSWNYGFATATENNVVISLIVLGSQSVSSLLQNFDETSRQILQELADLFAPQLVLPEPTSIEVETKVQNDMGSSYFYTSPVVGALERTSSSWHQKILSLYLLGSEQQRKHCGTPEASVLGANRACSAVAELWGKS